LSRNGFRVNRRDFALIWKSDNALGEIQETLEKAAQDRLAFKQEPKSEFAHEIAQFRMDWDTQLGVDLKTPQWRAEIRDALEKMRDMKRTIYGTIGVILLASVTTASLYEFLKSGVEGLQTQATATENDAKSQIEKLKTQLDSEGKTVYDDAAKNLDERLNRILSTDTLMDSALQTAKKDLKDEVEGQLGGETFTNIMSLLSSISVSLETESRGVEQSTEFGYFPTVHALKDPRQIRELLYSVRSLSNTYGPQLAGGRLEPRRRVSLLYVLDGIVARNHGDEITAEQWYRRAHDFDPTFPEAAIYLAQSGLQNGRYLGNGQFSDTADQADELSLLNGAIALAPDDLECRQSVIDVDRLQERWDDAIKAADDEIAREIGEARAMGFERLAEPGTYYRRGFVYFRRYAATYDKQPKPAKLHDENDRIEAVRSFRNALLADNDYLKALNNLVWYATHTWNDGFIDLGDSETVDFTLDPNDSRSQRFGIPELIERIDVLTNDPLTIRHAEMLNTIAEAHCDLGKYYVDTGRLPLAEQEFNICLKKAQESVDATLYYDPGEQPQIMARLRILSDFVQKEAAQNHLTFDR
jgi:hypothetical protein